MSNPSRIDADFIEGPLILDGWVSMITVICPCGCGRPTQYQMVQDKWRCLAYDQSSIGIRVPWLERLWLRLSGARHTYGLVAMIGLRDGRRIGLAEPTRMMLIKRTLLARCCWRMLG